MTPKFRRWLFETLYTNEYLYRFASTVPFAGQWRVWQRLILPRLLGRDVLELGPGLGDLFVDMLKAGYHCQAIEHSPQMLDAARKHVSRYFPGEEEGIRQGSAQHLPYEDTSFDTVVSTFPSEYIYDPRTISEVARVLRPGGRLLVIEGTQMHATGPLLALLVLGQRLVYGRTPKPSTHPRPADITSTFIEEAPFGQRIPLEAHGLRRLSEQISGPKWDVYLTQGEKPK